MVQCEVDKNEQGSIEEWAFSGTFKFDWSGILIDGAWHGLNGGYLLQRKVA